MSQRQKDKIYLEDARIIKVLEKPFIKKLLNSFDRKPLSASEIADSISFPKDKIYYHIKKLLSLNLLYVAETELKKGLEKKKFLPTARSFEYKRYDLNLKSTLKKKQIISKDKRTDRLEKKDQISDYSDSTNVGQSYYKEKRNLIKRRVINERRNQPNDFYQKFEKRINLRRKNIGRRAIDNIKKEPIRLENSLNSEKTKKHHHRLKNYNLSLNGVNEAISFVQIGSTVTFTYVRLELVGFEIKHVKTYNLPLVINHLNISTLTELVINVSNQFLSKRQLKEVFLAIHSDSYQYKMIYLNSRDQKRRNFTIWLKQKLEEQNTLKSLTGTFDYSKNKNHTIVCLSNNNQQILHDHSYLKKSGLNTRYNTSIPKILLNIHNYYSLNNKSKIGIIIFIDQKMTHLVSVFNNNLLSSSEVLIGLESFVEIIKEKKSNLDLINQTNITKAIHYLERVGIFHSSEKKKKSNNLNNRDTALNDLSEKLVDHIIRFITDLKLYDEANKIIPNTINKIYIGGVGSHIKGLDEKINRALNFKIDRIDRVNRLAIKRYYESKRNLWIQSKTNNLRKKQKRLINNLETVQGKILAHKNTVELAKSPESVKYKITRLEIDQNAKTRSIDRQTKKLIKSAQEFKTLKNNYIKEQDLLNTDINSISKNLEIKSSELLSKYEEYDYLMKSMSEYEFHTDTKNKLINEKDKRDFATHIKESSQKRDELNEKKEAIEKETDDLQLSILGYEEKIRTLSLNIDNGYDDVTISEYLVNSIQNTSKAFERSLLVHLKSINRLKKGDLKNLKRIGYLLVQNNEKLIQIRDKYEKEELTTLEVINNKPGEKEYITEVRKKLIPAINLVIQATDNLEKLKEHVAGLVNINIEISDLEERRKKLNEKIKQKEFKKMENEQGLSVLTNEMEMNQPILELKKEKKIKALTIVSNIRRLILETKDIIDEISEKDKEIAVIENEKMEVNQEIKTLKIDLEKIKETILNHNKNIKDIQAKLVKGNNDFENSLAHLNPELEKYELKHKSISEEISENLGHENGILTEIKNLKSRNNQIEQLRDEQLNTLKVLNKRKIPISQEKENQKSNLRIELNIKLKELDKKSDLSKRNAKKTRNSTIKNFFVRELKSLEKKKVAIQSLLIKSTKEMEKSFKEKERSKGLLDNKIKVKSPEIKILEQKISNWETLLKQGKDIQKKLDDLDSHKMEWENYLESERSIRDSKINKLNENIKRKQKQSYLLFMQKTLSKSNDAGKAERLAKEIVDENIAVDMQEIKKLSDSFNLIEKRYQLFINNYKKSHKKLYEEIKPFGGQEKDIKKKIGSAQKKIDEAKRVINSFKGRLDVKEEILRTKEEEFLKFNEEVQAKIDQIEKEIDQLPEKKARAKEEVLEKLQKEVFQIRAEKAHVKEQYKINLIELETVFDNNEIILEIKKIKDKLKSEDEEFSLNIVSIQKLNNSLEKIKRILSRLKDTDQGYLKNISSLKIKLDEVDSSYKLKTNLLNQEIKNEESHLFNCHAKEDKDNKKQRNLKLKEIQLESDIEKIEKHIFKLQKKVVVPFEKASLMIGDKIIENKDKSIKLSSQYNNLVQFEKDLTNQIKSYDNDIKELYKVLDNLQNKESSFIKTINIIDEDVSLLKKDKDKVKKLTAESTTSLNDIGEKHLKILEKLEELKDIYFPSKTLLSDRIDNIYIKIESYKNEKKKLNNYLSEVEKRLKNKRIESAEIDNQLSLINRNMKKVLELSIDDKEQAEQREYERKSVKEKINSYVDLVDMKARTKQLFDEITDAEKDITILKNRKNSMNRILSDNEKINQKKIEDLEQECKVLETKITSDKEELLSIERKLKELRNNEFNYGSRLELIQKELDSFRNKEEDYEIKLRELDRSLKEIKVKAETSSNNKNKIFENTIERDYMINLGLLMDAKNHLNLIPTEDKKDYQFFKSNNILKKSILILATTFGLAAYAQKTQIEPLINLLPKKKSELTLLNMRKSMKKEVNEKNMLFQRYESFLNQEKNTSSNMIKVLKYLTQVTPKRFKVTEMSLENKLKSKKQSSDNLAIKVKGFHSGNEENAIKMSEYFKEVLIQSKKFKSVDFSDGQKVSNYRTNFIISLTL